MFDGLLSWVSQIAALWGFTVALGAPIPIAQAPTPSPVNSTVLGAATIVPPPLQHPQPEPTPPVVVEPDPIKPTPVDPPVVQPVKPIKPPIYCIQSESEVSSHFRRCGGCGYSDPKYPSTNVYMCRYPVDSTDN